MSALPPAESDAQPGEPSRRERRRHGRDVANRAGGASPPDSVEPPGDGRHPGPAPVVRPLGRRFGGRFRGWFWGRWGVAVGGACVAVALGVPRLGRRPIWLDEAYTVGTAHDLVATWRGTGGTMALYYLIVWPIAQLSTDRVWIRLPSLLFAAAAVVVVHEVGRLVGGRRVAMAAAATLAVSWSLSRYALEARSYTLALLLVSLSWLGLVGAIRSGSGSGGRDGGQRWWWLFVVATVLAPLAHGLAAAHFVSQVAFLSLAPDRRRWLRRCLPVAVALAVEGIGLFALGAGEVANWIDPLRWAQVASFLRVLVGRGPALWVIGIPALAAIALAARGWATARRTPDPANRPDHPEAANPPDRTNRPDAAWHVNRANPTNPGDPPGRTVRADTVGHVDRANPANAGDPPDRTIRTDAGDPPGRVDRTDASHPTDRTKRADAGDRRDLDPWLGLVPVFWALGAPLLVLAISAVRPYGEPRYVLGALPGVALLAGAALARIRPAGLAVAAWLVVAVASLQDQSRVTSAGVEDWPALADRLAAEASDGDRVLTLAKLRAPLDYAWAERADRPELDPLSPTDELGAVRRFYDPTPGTMRERLLANAGDPTDTVWYVDRDITRLDDVEALLADPNIAARYQATGPWEFEGELYLVRFEPRQESMRTPVR